MTAEAGILCGNPGPRWWAAPGEWGDIQMNARGHGVMHQAVVFFEDDVPVREMLQVEFEAILDHVVGLPEYAGRDIRACFLRIDQRLRIVGAVFFLVDFDERGYVNHSWNVPLQHLLDNAGRGPDIGGGRIRLACRSQCPVPWHARQLWDPQLEGDDNSLRLMQAAVQRNRLGLTVDIPELDADDAARPAATGWGTYARAEGGPGIERRVQQELQERLASAREEHQLLLETTKAALQEQLDRVHQHYRTQVTELNESLAAAKQAHEQERQRVRQLQDRLAAQLEEFRRAREASQHDAQERDEQQARAQQQFEVELKARVDQATAELKEMLEMREVELFYREEQLGTLRDEIARLRQERERLIAPGSGGILQLLADNGVALVAYQPGTDVMSVPLADVSRYLDSPQAYVAEKCAVSVEQYRLWLDHYALPVCCAQLADGSVCGDPIDKVERPHRFIAGISDRCAAHAGTADVAKPDVATRDVATPDVATPDLAH